MSAEPASPQSARVIEVLEQAIREVRDGEDALPTIDLARTLLKIEAGESSGLDEIESMYVFDCDRLNN